MKLFHIFFRCNAINRYKDSKFPHFRNMPGSIHSKSSIDFYKEIKAPQRAISILEDGFKLPFLNKEVPHFWIHNNKSLFDNYDFAKKKLDDWIKDGYVTETFQRPPRISALSVATRVLVNCKDLAFVS